MSRMIKSVSDVISEHKKKGTFIPIELVKKIVDDSLTGLRKIHSKKLYHGHLKPTNILLHEDDEYKLSDMGIFS